MTLLDKLLERGKEGREASDTIIARLAKLQRDLGEGETPVPTPNQPPETEQSPPEIPPQTGEG